MRKLHVEICNERFLPRFGVDRLLVLLANRLSEAGHAVSFVSLRCDLQMLARCSKDITVIDLPPGLDMAETEYQVSKTMYERWKRHVPDVLVCGGWPFFGSTVCASDVGTKSIFIDAGAVAQDGLSGPPLSIQRELRRIRQLSLPLIDRVLPISDFIRVTQTEHDRGSESGVQTVLLGADHMSQGTFGGHQQEESNILDRIDLAISRGEKLLLLLGRFEQQGYKNSCGVYDLLRLVQREIPEVRLLILDAGENCQVPQDLQSVVYLLGAPGDLTLTEVMKRCAAGVSLSLWEGFNLPLAEMQWIDRPAFAFNLGAHPEVIADPWLLCESLEEMARKLSTVIKGETSVDLAAAFAAFRQVRRWETTLSAWQNNIEGLASPSLKEASGTCVTSMRERRIVLVDVTNASLDPANPGVIRVARRLCSELQQHRDLDLVFAAWSRDSGDYIFLDRTRRSFLEGFGGPKDGLGMLAANGRQISPGQLVRDISVGRSNSPILLLPEVMFDDQALARIEWAKARGFKVAAILYDLIPIFHQEFCDANVSAGFPGYLTAVLQADSVWSISGFTRDCLARYATETNQQMPRSSETVLLPGQFGERSRENRANCDPIEQEIRILCVSTLEPRKNHLRLLEAFQRLRAQRPELPIRLVLIGNRYAGAPDIAEAVQKASREDSSIEWRGPAGDDQLATEFERAAFTVYPSLIEGFGLPILESLWMERPCLTHNGGVMRELAVEGGCVMVDMTDVQAIAASLESLATDQGLRVRLRMEATQRQIQTWQDYAGEISQRLTQL